MKFQIESLETVAAPGKLKAIKDFFHGLMDGLLGL
ncbi:hypothetical protein JOC77_000166 [Peribacillus deserti]|uniref:Uncharacterized protein n=1 Tax=Peribacillus deserti TaxID=673318 RepID=A0ABS2QCA1_9BACI|nr:hypothetical protein [Peribacillus deserti]